jgi:hypothetical protein
MKSNQRKIERPCPYCGRPYRVSARVAEESPFCSVCLPERVAQREAEIGPTVLVERGDYFVVTRLRPGTPGSMPS